METVVQFFFSSKDKSMYSSTTTLVLQVHVSGVIPLLLDDVDVC